jgi:hypothetical protein
MSELGPDCVKTSTRGERAELFSLLSSFDGACQSGSFLIPRYRDKRSTRKFDVGIFTQPRSKPEVSPLKLLVRSTLSSGHRLATAACPFRANSGSPATLFDHLVSAGEN